MPNIKNGRRGIEPCDVEDCDRLIFAKDWCKKHYDRYNTHGDPTTKLSTGPKPENIKPPRDYFWEQVIRLHEDECWLWTGHVNKPKGSKRLGYGRFMTGRKHYQAHRYAYEDTTGEKLASYVPVHHKCANTLCVNPKHLQAVTPEENTAEMLERNHYIKRIAELEALLSVCACQVNT